MSDKTDGIPGVDRRHRPSDFYHERTNFKFIKHSRRYLIISGAVVVLSLLALPLRGLNLGIDFKGGISWEVKAQGVTPTIGGVRDALAPTGQSDARVTILSPASGGKSIRVQAKLLKDPLTDIENALASSAGVEPANVLVDVTGTRGSFSIGHVTKPDKAKIEAALRAVGATGTVTVTGSSVDVSVPKLPASPQDKVTEALAKYAHATPADVTLNTVGPTWGHEVSRKALQALIAFFIVLALYLAIRFEAKMSAAAIVAVLHDIAFTVGVYAIVHFPVTPATVTAFLTILGFSLYDTVVVFDKIKENTSSVAAMGKSTYGEMVDRSLNQVLMRSLSTSLVALLAGLFIGTYSSIFVATPLLVWMKEREPQYKALKQRRARQGAAAVPAAAQPAMARVGAGAPIGNGPDDADRAFAEELAPTRRERGVPGPPAVPRTPIAPRPRQQRGRKRK
ncbi:MAG: preprotein translocase subunit SecF [Actinomycetota bacterium]|nr:preprotein translocase subunit SecF [Actinomycetota bacterium]